MIQVLTDLYFDEDGSGAHPIQGLSDRHVELFAKAFERERRRRLRIGEMLRLATLPIALPRDQVTRNASGRPSSSVASSPAWARWVRRAIRERIER